MLATIDPSGPGTFGDFLGYQFSPAGFQQRVWCGFPSMNLGDTPIARADLELCVEAPGTRGPGHLPGMNRWSYLLLVCGSGYQEAKECQLTFTK